VTQKINTVNFNHWA